MTVYSCTVCVVMLCIWPNYSRPRVFLATVGLKLIVFGCTLSTKLNDINCEVYYLVFISPARIQLFDWFDMCYYWCVVPFINALIFCVFIFCSQKTTSVELWNSMFCDCKGESKRGYKPSIKPLL